MEDHCRLCLKENSIPMENIATSKLKCSDLNLIDCLYWIFGVEVAVYDPYSKYVCKDCVEIVKYVGHFREIFRNNQLVMQIKYMTISKEHLNKSEGDDERTTRDLFTTSERRNSYISVSLDVVQQYCQPIISVPKLEDSNISDEYEKITDTLYKKRKDISKGYNKNTKFKDAWTTTESPNPDRVSVPIDIFEKFAKPSLILPRLEYSNISEKYDKVDDITYRKMAFHTKGKRKRKVNLIEYYYRKPTSALRDLMKHKNDTLSKSEVNKNKSVNDISEGSPSLFKINKVFHVEVCHFCSKIFKTRESLIAHYKLYHQKSMINKRKRRRKFKKVGRKFKQKNVLVQKKTETFSKETPTKDVTSTSVSNSSSNNNSVNNSHTTNAIINQGDPSLDTNVLVQEDASLDILKVQNISDIKQRMRGLQDKYESPKLISLTDRNLSQDVTGTEELKTENLQNIDNEFKDMPILKKIDKLNDSETNTDRTHRKKIKAKKRKKMGRPSLPKMPRLIKMCDPAKINKTNKHSFNKTERLYEPNAAKRSLNKDPQCSNSNVLKITSKMSTNENLTFPNNMNKTYEPLVADENLPHSSNTKEKINVFKNSTSKIKECEPRNFIEKSCLSANVKSEKVEEHISNHTNLDILLGNIVRNKNHVLTKTKNAESSKLKPIIYTNITSRHIRNLQKKISELKNISVKSNVTINKDDTNEIFEKRNMPPISPKNGSSRDENDLENILDINSGLQCKKNWTPLNNLNELGDTRNNRNDLEYNNANDIIDLDNDTAINELSYTKKVLKKRKSGNVSELTQFKELNGKTISLSNNYLNVPKDTETNFANNQQHNVNEIIVLDNDPAILPPSNNLEEHNRDDLSIIDEEGQSYTKRVSERLLKNKFGHEYELKQCKGKNFNDKIVSGLSKRMENIKKRRELDQLKKLRLILQNEIVKSVTIDQNYIFRDRVCF